MGDVWIPSYKPGFLNEVLALPDKHKNQVLTKIADLERDPHADGHTKKQLKHMKNKLHRLRSGDYRVFYTYDDEGNHRWYLAQGPIVEDHAELVVYQTSGGRFMRPDPIDVSPVGSAQLVFSSCNQGSLQFDLAGRSGELALTRITGHCQDELLPPATLSPPARATAGVALP